MNVSIVVDDIHGDAAADALAKVLNKWGRARILPLTNFMFGEGFRFDRQSGFLIRNGPRVDARIRANWVCNRVIQVSPGVASLFDNHAGILKPNFVLSSYVRALSERTVLGVQLGQYPAYQALPLYAQWKLFSQEPNDLEVPRFAYGFQSVAPDTSDFRNPIWKDPFDVYAWESSGEIGKGRMHAFVVDKPSGRPAVAYFVGDASDVFMLDALDDVDNIAKERIARALTPIRTAFKTFMGESLFFIDGARVTFAAFTPYLKSSVGHRSFSLVLERGFAPVLD